MTLPSFVLRHLYSLLLLQHQCKCEINEKSKVLEHYLEDLTPCLKRPPGGCGAQFEPPAQGQNPFLSCKRVHSRVYWISMSSAISRILIDYWSYFFPFPQAVSFTSYLWHHHYTSHSGQKPRSHSFFFFFSLTSYI